MALNADGCKHPRWRSDFAANGKMHEFCVDCGAERRLSHSANAGEAARLRNGVRWIRHVAAMNSVIPCGPQQMRALSVLAEKLLDGAELADYDSSIEAARAKAQEGAFSVSVDPVATDCTQHDDGLRASIGPVPEQTARPDPVQPAPAAETDQNVVLNGHPS